MANPNLAAAGNIYGKTDVMNVTTTATALTSNAAASGKVLKINTVVVSNTTSSSSVDVSVDLYRSSTAYYLAKVISVPARSSIVIVAKENPLYLAEGDSIRVVASAANAADAVCSYEELY